MIFNFSANENHFLKTGFTLSLVLKVRGIGTPKWPNCGLRCETTLQTFDTQRYVKVMLSYMYIELYLTFFAEKMEGKMPPDHPWVIWFS